MLLQRYPIMWQGLMALKNDHAVVQMHFISGNPHVARGSLPCGPDGITLPLRIAQRMRLEQQQLEGVARKVQMEQEHCILLALPCGRDAMDVLQQSNNLRHGFITYLQLKQAAGIVNIAAPGSQQVSSPIRSNSSVDPFGGGGVVDPLFGSTRPTSLLFLLSFPRRFPMGEGGRGPLRGGGGMDPLF